MAIIADKQYSLVDYAKQFDPSGQELAIAEVLSKSNDIIADALVVESSWTAATNTPSARAFQKALGAAPTRA